MKERTLKNKKRKVTFSFQADEAKEVHLVGEFNEWKAGAHPMKNSGNGKWSRSLMLPEGVFEYKFLVDGHWVVDPQSAQVCSNCFGTQNSVIRVGR